MARNSVQRLWNETWWKAVFLSNLCKFLRTNDLVVIEMYFSLFLKGLKIFLNPRLSLKVPLRIFISCPFKKKGHATCCSREDIHVFPEITGSNDNFFAQEIIVFM